MPTFSTDDLPSHERFDYWREVRAAKLFGVTLELDAAQRPSFRGSVSAFPVADAGVVELRASPYRVYRTEADIAQSPSQSLCICQQLDGASWYDTGRSGEFAISAGQIATAYTDLPYETRPLTGQGYNLRLVRIPFTRCTSLVGNPSDLVAEPVVAEPGVAALFSSYLEAFVQQAPYLTGLAADTAVQTLAQLAILARGLVAPQEDNSRIAIRVARLQAARQSIERNFHRHDLSPEVTARMLGISVRQLHLLFEPTNTTYAGFLRAKRLAHARWLLDRSTTQPVADIAFACGFASLATFYRAFRSAYGHSPSELRQPASRG
jgi:AraC-like DNA-binding protein